MAERKTQVQRRAAGPGSANLARFWLGMLVLATISALLFIWSAALLALVGLLPTFAAFVADRESGRPLATSVGATNLAGVFAVTLDFHMGTTSLSAAIDALAHGIAPMLMFGSAAIGWALYYCMPVAALAYLQASETANRRVMVERQKVLVEEWGSEVSTRTDADVKNKP